MEMEYKGEHLKIHAGFYAAQNIALHCTGENGEPFAKITVNFPELEPGNKYDGLIALDVNKLPHDFIKAFANRLIPTSKSIHSGLVEYPLFAFTPNTIEELKQMVPSDYRLNVYTNMYHITKDKDPILKTQDSIEKEIVMLATKLTAVHAIEFEAKGLDYRAFQVAASSGLTSAAQKLLTLSVLIVEMRGEAVDDLLTTVSNLVRVDLKEFDKKDKH